MITKVTDTQALIRHTRGGYVHIWREDTPSLNVPIYKCLHKGKEGWTFEYSDISNEGIKGAIKQYKDHPGVKRVYAKRILELYSKVFKEGFWK